MMRRWLWMIALALSTTACGSDAPSETSLEACSNGRDDDRDGLVDCEDLACRVYAFCTQAIDAGMPVVDAESPFDGSVCTRPVDVVLSLDVSSARVPVITALRVGSQALFDRLRALDPNARVGLVVFVDDALAVDGCEPLRGPEELATRLDEFRVSAPANRSPVSNLLNVDCPENSLDALSLAARCPWRGDAARIVVHLTDDTFVEHPSVLSGPYGPGIVVESTYAAVANRLAEAQARVLAVTRTGAGRPCGAGASADVGAGFQTPFEGRAPLPDSTGGRFVDLAALDTGALDLPAEISGFAADLCSR